VNSGDKIKVYEGEDSKNPYREFLDPVSKAQWKKGCFSYDGDCIIGGEE
jgi:hypothetical protein